MARRSHRRKRVANEIRQLPWRNVVNPYAPIEILSADQVETIVQTSLKVLAKQGMRFLGPGSPNIGVRANAIWKQLLSEYEQPPLDPAIDEALVDYVAKRKQTLMAEA